VEWTLPDYQHLLRILKNPTYAGAFVHGRTRSQARVVDGRSRKSGGHRVPMEQWEVLIKDHHPAYIAWDLYLKNQRTLASNRTKSHAVSCGAARDGGALLAGLLRCARCGHKMHVAYRGRNGRGARYYCRTGDRELGKPSCHAFASLKVDRAVAESVLEACSPMGVEASLQALDGNCAEQDQRQRMLELALQRARYEVDRTRRQYDAVDPANRLVAAELEARWNAALVAAAEAESRLQAGTATTGSIDDRQRERLLTLGTNLSALWEAPNAPMEIKKRILRTVIQEIVADVNHSSGQVEMRLHWSGGVHTLVCVRKNRTGRNGNATDTDVLELIRDWAMAWPDGYIAAMLNRLGHQTGFGKSWTQSRVKSMRSHHKIPAFVKGGQRPWLTMSEAAKSLSVSVAVVRTMVSRGHLPARQAAKGAPWMIQCEDLSRPAVQSWANAARSGTSVPRDETGQTLIPYQ
jgi:hypothetical protein